MLQIIYRCATCAEEFKADPNATAVQKSNNDLVDHLRVHSGHRFVIELGWRE